MPVAEHVFSVGKAVVRLRIQVAEVEFMVSMDLSGVDKAARRDRRAMQRWAKRIIKPLESDPRPIRLVTTENGRVKTVGASNGTFGVAIQFP